MILTVCPCVCLGHISAKTLDNSIILCYHVAKETDSITVALSMYIDCSSRTCTGDHLYMHRLDHTNLMTS